jgi:trehalose 6-phosphate synthase/phosphatase
MTLGLQSALNSFHQAWDTVWVGWPGVVDPKDEADVRESLAKSKCLPVFMPEELVRRYYDGFSNNTIWPLLHSFPGSAQYSEDDWEGIVWTKLSLPLFHSHSKNHASLTHSHSFFIKKAYKKVNMMFCETLVSLIKADDYIWIHGTDIFDVSLTLVNQQHYISLLGLKSDFTLFAYHQFDLIRSTDYHLMLLPKLIRTRCPDTAIGFFLHIPFPHYDIFRLLPWGREIIDGLLYSHLVGMHTYDYTQNFLSTGSREHLLFPLFAFLLCKE